MLSDRKNIKYSRKYKNVVDALVQTKDGGETAIFPTIMSLSLFSAILGFHEETRENVESESLDIPMSVYLRQKDDGLIYLIALNEKDDFNLLRDENLDEVIKIFEKYFNGGLSILEDWLSTLPKSDWTDKIMDQIIELTSDPAKTDASLSSEIKSDNLESLLG
jgi:dnd system-associated protein 4